ncbi:chloride channel protein [Sediminibacterium soli]|uniref:chloride channel protein n=1 Tax=Sediminibacterium soli TaxID=2698829 RepID=UPI001379D1F4|nr:chloride channel protein [Sediminibacterium soli]NCI46804.1 chloride channel protein [Sediminibacterium soli]
MLRSDQFIRRNLKHYFDKIRNEKIRRLILQAFPFWIASLITGVFAVIYAKLFAYAEKGAGYLYQQAHWSFFIATPICFFVAVWLVNRFAPLARGSGIPQVITAIELATPREHNLVDKLLSIRIIVVKVISSCIMAIGGGIIGREGPTIQIAGSVFRKINNMLPEWWPRISKRNMVMTGAAAGLAAAFNTPLGGIVFAMEELSRTHISFYKTAIFSAVIIAGLTAQSMLGSYLYIGYPDLQHLSLSMVFVVVIVALLSGLFSSMMCKLLLKIFRWKMKLTSVWKKRGYLLLCAMTVGAMAYFVGQHTLNSGKDLMTQLLFTDEKQVDWYMPLLRMLGSVVSFTSGGAGGVFAPALSAGAGIGAVVAHWFHLTPQHINLMVLAGMVAFLTGVTRSPFTSAILVLEMTDGHTVIFYLMIAALAANLIAYFVDKHSLYDQLKHGYIRELQSAQ